METTIRKSIVWVIMMTILYIVVLWTTKDITKIPSIEHHLEKAEEPINIIGTY